MKHRAAIITAFDPLRFKGGIETYFIQLRALLNSHEVPYDLYCIDDRTHEQSFHNRYLGDLYDAGRRLFDSRDKYDLVIANGFYGIGVFPPASGTFNIFHSTHIGFAEDIKYAVPNAQYVEWKYLWGNFCESVSGYGRTKIAVSESVRNELQKYYGFDDVHVLNNAVDTGLFRKIDASEARRKWGIPGSSAVGLYVGRWDMLKGSDLLERVMKMRPDVHWIIVLGTGSDVRSVPAMDNVSVFEQIAHESMHEIYSAADFLLFPSRYEGFGYVIIEAMACGLPVITTDVGIAKTIYRDRPFSELLLPAVSGVDGDPAEAAGECINTVLSDPDLRAGVAIGGRRLVERDFSMDKWQMRAAEILGISR
jgi:glycosyltransferase involved in cell wall biosynthesis